MGKLGVFIGVGHGKVMETSWKAEKSTGLDWDWQRKAGIHRPNKYSREKWGAVWSCLEFPKR